MENFSQEFNPFQSVDIYVPAEFHEEFLQYCQSPAGAIIDHSPFPRMVDLWFLSVCIAARLNLKPVSFKNAVKIAPGAILSTDQWRVHVIMLIAITQNRNVQKIISNPQQMMSLANSLAAAGLPEIIKRLSNEDSSPIWNLSEYIYEILKG